MKASASVIFLSTLAAVVTICCQAKAQQGFVAYQVPGGTVGNEGIQGLGVGNDFRVVRPVTVSQLGLFDNGTNVIQGSASLTVQLFERNGTSGLLLESLNFDAATPGIQIGGSLFKPLTLPVTLLPGAYTIAAYGFNAANLEGNAGLPPFVGSPPPWTMNGGSSLLFEGSSRYDYVTVGQFPTQIGQGPANQYAAGTFIFSPTNLPAPPSAADYEALTAGVSSFPLEDVRHLGSIAVVGESAFPVLVEPGGNRLVFEAAGTYAEGTNGARAVVFSHTQWGHSENDGRMTLFENAIKWASHKSNPADIVVGFTTNLNYEFTTNFDLAYFASRGYHVIPLALWMPYPSNSLPPMDVLVADWHAHFDNRSLNRIKSFTADGGGLVMTVKPRFQVYPHIRPSFLRANEILQPFGLAYRSSLAVPADLGFTNIQAIPYPTYFSAFPAAQMLHQDRIGAIHMDSLAKAVALNTINYASSGQPDLLSALTCAYSGVTNTGALPPSASSANFVDLITLTGAQADTNRLGNWFIRGTDLVSSSRRGSVEYGFSVPAADVYKIIIDAAQDVSYNHLDGFTLLLSLDGQNLGRQQVDPGTNGGTTEFLTPYIPAGPHLLRLFWDNPKEFSALDIKTVHVQTGLGPDQDGNGIKDWVDQLIQTQSGLDLTNTTVASYTSPVCLEGRDPYPGLMQILVQGADNQTHSMAPQAVSYGRWFANIPLSAYVNATPLVQVSYQNGALIQTRTLQWAQLNLLTAGDMIIRKGDSLLFNALPVGSSNANLQISVGTNLFSGRTVQPIAVRFTNAGVFSVTGTYAPYAGAPISGSIHVTVVDQTLSNSPACWVGMERVWDLQTVAPMAVFETDSRLFCEQTATLPNNGEEFSLLADENEPRSIIARLGSGGPILDATRARGFNLWSASDTNLRVVQTYADGSQLVEMLVICSPVLPDLTFEIDTIVGGITFDDGTVTKVFSSADLDPLGQYTVRFLRPASARTSVCHSIKVYQGAGLVGYLR